MLTKTSQHHQNKSANKYSQSQQNIRHAITHASKCMLAVKVNKTSKQEGGTPKQHVTKTKNESEHKTIKSKNKNKKNKQNKTLHTKHDRHKNKQTNRQNQWMRMESNTTK